MNEIYAGMQDCQDFFCQTIPFDLRKKKQLHSFHSYPYKRALGMRLTRPALKSSKVSGNRTGLSRGTLAGYTAQCQLQLPAGVLLLPILHIVRA